MDYPVENQKLILKGKILSDDVNVESMNYTEKDFIVCMVTKPKQQGSTVATPTTATASIAPSTATTQHPATPQSAVPAPVTPDAQPAPVNAFTELATGNSFESAVANLVEMGFAKDQVILAMRAAFNNPDRAAEYLMTVLTI